MKQVKERYFKSHAAFQDMLKTVVYAVVAIFFVISIQMLSATKSRSMEPVFIPSAKVTCRDGVGNIYVSLMNADAMIYSNRIHLNRHGYETSVPLGDCTYSWAWPYDGSEEVE